MNNRPSKAATRKPIPKYIIESITSYAFKLAARTLPGSCILSGENYLNNGRIPELNSRFTSFVFSRKKFVRPSRVRRGAMRLRSIKMIVTARTNALTFETKLGSVGESAASFLTKPCITLNNKSVSTVAMAASSAASSFANTAGSSVPNVSRSAIRARS